MPARKAGHSGPGTLGRFPLFELGAWVYWNSRMGKRAQLRGGKVSVGDNFVYTYSGGSVADAYTNYDPGTGKFIEVAFASATPPLDGKFGPDRVNRWRSSKSGGGVTDRGSMTREAGLTLVYLAPAPSNYILQYTAGLPPEVPVITNGAGTAQRMYKLVTSSATNNMMWSILVRKNDGSQVTSSTITLGASTNANPLGADICTGSTRYDKIREDGWYRVSRILPTQPGSPTVYFWASWAVGAANVMYEAPQVEAYTPASSAEEPSEPILSGAGADVERNLHLVEITGSYAHPSCGWMGATVIPRTDAADFTSLPLGDILTWRVDNTNRTRILYSDTARTIKFFMEQTGATQIDLSVPQAMVKQGTPLGVVVTWGKRAGSIYAMLAANGDQQDVTDSAFTPPSGAASVYIGSNVSAAGSPANLLVQHAAFGDRALDMHEVRILSRWFQTQAFSTLGIKGA